MDRLRLEPDLERILDATDLAADIPAILRATDLDVAWVVRDVRDVCEATEPATDVAMLRAVRSPPAPVPARLPPPTLPTPVDVATSGG